jgi:uncharacterized protein YidB (DUF937 family)
MSLLDNLIGSALSAVAGDKAPALSQLLKDNGGVSGLAEKFRNGGLGATFSSWVSTGANQLASPQQIEAVLGNAQVQAFAKLLGIDTAQASDFLAKTLPQLIDKLTPDGTLPAETAAVASSAAATTAVPPQAAKPAVTEAVKVSAVTQFLTDNGGVAGLYEKFRSGELSKTFASWVSTGANELINPQQIEATLGNAQVQAVAKRLGIDTTQASDFLARTLPQLIDKLTPEGQVPAAGAAVLPEAVIAAAVSAESVSTEPVASPAAAAPASGTSA